MTNRVWLTGDAVVDLIPQDESTYLKCPGGAPANVAVGIARLKGECAFFGRVGADPLGRFMLNTLARENVDVTRLSLDPDQRTSTVLVDLDKTGERTFTFMVKPSADQFMTREDIPGFGAGQWLHACSIALANEPSRNSTLLAMERIKSASGFVSFDPNLREEVWPNPGQLIPTVMKAVALADVVKFSEEELTFLTDTSSIDDGLAAISKLDIHLVVITLGAKGALVVFKGQRFEIAGKAISKVVDTTGAGDAFVAGMLACLSSNHHWQQIETVKMAIHWGNACGALAITQKGAMTALPTREELDNWLL